MINGFGFVIVLEINVLCVTIIVNIFFNAKLI